MDDAIKTAVQRVLRSAGRPMQLKVIDRELPNHNRYDLRDALDELQDEGVVERLRGKGFRLAGPESTKRDQVRRGVIHVNPRGFGFVRTAEIGRAH
ncbi:MAG: hypothetical protein VB934_08175, partial [Polyangiaceae bacterium]